MSVLNSLFSPVSAFSPIGYLNGSPSGPTLGSALGLGNSSDGSQMLLMTLLLSSLLKNLGSGTGQDIGTLFGGLTSPANTTVAKKPAMPVLKPAMPVLKHAPEVTPPRSGDLVVGGYRWLGRSIDKARLKAHGQLAQFHLKYPCPQDQQLLAKLGIDSETFKEIAGNSTSDEEVLAALKARGVNIM